MSTEFENQHQLKELIDRLAGSEWKSFKRSMRALETEGDKYAATGLELSSEQINRVSAAMLGTIPRAWEVLKRMSSQTQEITNNVIILLRNEVKDALQNLEDDSFVVQTSDGKASIKIDNLFLHRFFEDYLRFQLEIQKTNGTITQPAREFFLRLQTSDPAQLANLLSNELNTIQNRYPDLKEPAPLGVIFSLEELTAIKSLVKDELGYEPLWLSSRDSLTKALQEVSFYETSPAKPLHPQIIKEMEVLKSALEKLLANAALNPDIFQDGPFKSLGPTGQGGPQGPRTRAEEIADAIGEIINRNNSIQDRDPVLNEWKNFVDYTTKVNNMGLKNYIEEVEKRAPSGKLTEEDVKGLEYAIQELELYRQNVENVKYVQDSHDDEYNLRLAESKRQYIDSLNQQLISLLSQAKEAVLKRVVGGVTPPGGTGTPEAGLDLEKTPKNYLQAFWEFFKLAERNLVDKIKTNPKPGDWTEETRIAFEYYRSLRPSEVEAQQAEWKQVQQLIDNVGKAWEYRYDTMKSQKVGLVHDVAKLEVYVNPEDWRQIFERYGLALYKQEGSKKKTVFVNESGEELNIDDTTGEKTRTGRRVNNLGELVPDPAINTTEKLGPNERVRPAGFFWEMWDLAVKIAGTDYRDLPTNPLPWPYNKKFEYGQDDFANNAGEFYDYVIEQFLETTHGNAFKKRFEGATKEGEMNLVLEQVKGMFDIGNLYDDIYAAKAARGGSISHEPTFIELGGGVKKELWRVVRPLHSASNYASNSTAKSHEVMNIAMASRDGLYNLFRPLLTPKNWMLLFDKNKGKSVLGGASNSILNTTAVGTKEMYEKVDLYVNATLDADLVLHKFSDPYQFPNLAESILAYDLSVASRYFNVDAAGWGWMWSTLWEPFSKEGLTEDQAFDKITDWVKQGLGRAKLIKGAVSQEDFVNLSKLYFSRVFAAFKGNKIVAAGDRFTAEKTLAGPLLGLSNVPRETNILRKRAIQDISKSTTLTYLGNDADIFKHRILSLLGAEFKDRDPKSMELTDRVVKRVAPPWLLRVFRREEVSDYVEYMWNHHAYQDYRQRGYQSLEQLKAALSPEGLTQFVHPPYLPKETEIKEKK